MRKNGSRLISKQQYRLTDLFLFAVIMVAAEGFARLALKAFPGGALFTFSLMLPITLTVMVRWGWPGVAYAGLSGVLYCAFNKAAGAQYLFYGVGNMFIALLLIPIYLIGSHKIASRWWSSVLLIIGGWVCVYLGRATLSSIYYAASAGTNITAADCFLAFLLPDLVSLAVAIALVLAFRRFEGMFENQNFYLRKVENERQERMRRGEFGDEPIDLDEESLDIINRGNDLYD